MQKKIKTLKQATAFIFNRINLEKSYNQNYKRLFRLDRMESLLKDFGQPHIGYKKLHIAGTKGKGSTAIFLASVLEATGEKTGIYSSPHVTSILERITIGLKAIETDLFIELTNRVHEYLKNKTETDYAHAIKPTSFEILTLIAFCAFRECNCTYAIIETGIGGRLDATNIIEPEASILTPIGIEHTELLGDTIEQIVWEKCGIIKKNTPVFSGFQNPDVIHVIKQSAKEKKAPLFFLKKFMDKFEVSLSLKGTTVKFKPKAETVRTFYLRMIGKFQAENAIFTYYILKTLYPKIKQEDFEHGFKQAFIPGRMEIISHSPPLILDGAHTPHSIERLLESFFMLFSQPSILIFGAVLGKKIQEMVAILSQYFQEIIISQPGNFKKSNITAIKKEFLNNFKTPLLIKNPKHALRMAWKISKKHKPILVTGSFYLISEIRKIIKG